MQLAGEPDEEQDTDMDEVMAGLRRIQAAAAAIQRDHEEFAVLKAESLKEFAVLKGRSQEVA